jgi:hypothetical protein
MSIPIEDDVREHPVIRLGIHHGLHVAWGMMRGRGDGAALVEEWCGRAATLPGQ